MTPAESPAPEPTSRLWSRRLRDLGLLAAIVGAIGLGYLQYRSGDYSSRRPVEGIVVSDSRRGTELGTTQHLVSIRLADGTLVTALAPADYVAVAGATLAVDELTFPDGRIEYRTPMTTK